MFHHFHGGHHPSSQGSFSDKLFFRFIEESGVEYLLNPDEWLFKFERGSLSERDYCITFDDNLRSQADLAWPILNHFNKRAFWFVYSSPYQGVLEKLELYRYFRTTHYPSIEDFYADFFKFSKESDYAAFVKAGISEFPSDYLAEYPFYSLSDRVFRYLRDRILGPERYKALMDQLMIKRNFVIQDVAGKLWLRQDELKTLSSQGHLIGMHSHTHPTFMAGLGEDDQRREYSENKEFLESITGTKVLCMSHPCNSYNQDTLQVLKQMGIRIGFRADNHLKTYTHLELPRLDQAEFYQADL